MTFIRGSHNFKKLSAVLFATSFFLIGFRLEILYSQYASQNYANNEPVNWQVTHTKNFKIVYDPLVAGVVKKVKPAAEKIYEAYKGLLGTEPVDKVVLYINRDKLILSEKRALDRGEVITLWHKNPFFNCFRGGLPEWKYLLRHEIAFVFQQAAQSSLLGPLQAFLLAPLWSAGLPLYLSVPRLTECDRKWLYHYWNVDKRAQQPQYRKELKLPVLGRSQIHFYNKIFPADLLSELYNVHKQFLGIPYFDFDYAFLKTFGVPYTFFYSQWKRQQFEIYNDSLSFSAISVKNVGSTGTKMTDYGVATTEIKSEPYHSFLNIHLSLPVVLPYYLSTSDYGLGGVLRWKSPLQLHKFQFAGILSFPDIAGQSFFYTSYVNNRFSPRIKLSFKHYTSKSDWLDLSVRRSNIAAASSLWKIDGNNNPNSNWYAGFMLRYMNVDYFSPASADHSTEVVFDNKRTTQTDLRLVLANRTLKPTSFNFVHPLKGHGFRISVTSSGPFLDSEVQYARFYGEAFTLIPTSGRQRIYLYAAGALDVDDPIGADYLYFADDGDYELPEPKLLGSIGRAVEGYIRGYEQPVAGEYFAMGSVEYRIPLLLQPDNLLGVLPLPKLTFAFFTEGGFIGEARTSYRKDFTAYRLSLGAELKAGIGFGGFNAAFKAGIAQALDQPFGPIFYFTIQPAIPF